MNIQDYKGVFVFAQQVDNELSGIALELVGKGKDLASTEDRDHADRQNAQHEDDR